MLEALGNLVFTDMTQLTPQTLLEYFVFIAILEFLGVIISYTKGV